MHTTLHTTRDTGATAEVLRVVDITSTYIPDIAWKEGIWFLALAASSCLFVQMLGSPPLAQYLSG